MTGSINELAWKTAPSHHKASGFQSGVRQRRPKVPLQATVVKTNCWPTGFQPHACDEGPYPTPLLYSHRKILPKCSNWFERFASSVGKIPKLELFITHPACKCVGVKLAQCVYCLAASAGLLAAWIHGLLFILSSQDLIFWLVRGSSCRGRKHWSLAISWPRRATRCT